MWNHFFNLPNRRYGKRAVICKLKMRSKYFKRFCKVGYLKSLWCTFDRYQNPFRPQTTIDCLVVSFGEMTQSKKLIIEIKMPP